MNIDKMIIQIEEATKTHLNHPFKIGILPNDGNIILGFPEAILDFDDLGFKIYTFDGLIKLTYIGDIYEIKYSDISEIELGKYNFKEKYMKVILKDERFVAFNYSLKRNKYPYHAINVDRFFNKIESLSGTSNNVVDKVGD